MKSYLGQQPGWPLQCVGPRGPFKGVVPGAGGAEVATAPDTGATIAVAAAVGGGHAGDHGQVVSLALELGGSEGDTFLAQELEFPVVHVLCGRHLRLQRV